MSDETPDEATDATEADAPAVDERDAKIAELEAQLAEADDRIAELESTPAPEPGSSFLGVRTAALDAFEENQFRGEVQAWERETGLSYDDGEPGAVDEAVQAKADEVKTPVAGA